MGWTDEATRAVWPALHTMVEAGHTPGGIVVAGDAHGHQSIADGVTAPHGGLPVTADSTYDLASLTKVVATWPLVGTAVASGVLDLDAPVGKYVNGVRGAGAEVTVRQILTHTSGLMPSTRLDQYTGDDRDIAVAIVNEPLDRPGEHRYINRGFILAGLILERVLGRPPDRALDRYAASIPTQQIMYGPVRRGPAVAPTERRLTGGHRIHGTVHDENASILGGVAGHAGVFATARGLTAYAESLLERWARGDTWVRESWAPAVRVDEETARGLAWLISDRGLVYHHGYTGGSIYLRPDEGRFLVVLANPIFYGRARTGLDGLRRAARAAIED